MLLIEIWIWSLWKLKIFYFKRETLPEGVARPSVPQQAIARGKTILSDHPAGQATETSASATQPHGMGGAAASKVTGKLKLFVVLFLLEGLWTLLHVVVIHVKIIKEDLLPKMAHGPWENYKYLMYILVQ